MSGFTSTGDNNERERSIFMPTKDKKAPRVRTHWMEFLIYPDNPYQMKYLDYCKHRGFDMAYITHDASETEKEHIHCMVYFDYPCTDKSMESSIGSMPVTTTPDGRKKPLIGAELETMRINAPDLIEEVPIFRSPSSPTDNSYTVKNVSNPAGYLHYMVHDDFKAMMEGKKPYSWDCITYCGDETKVKSLIDTESTNKLVLYQRCASYFSDGSSCQDVLKRCLEQGDFEMVRFFEGHTLFIKHFFEDK